MKAIALIPGTSGVHLIERSEPSIQADDEVKVRMIRVGICGTDREESSGGRALAPSGQKELVIGHEMFGQVVETGKAVTRVKPGDFAVFTVRRGCGRCLPCSMNRSDMCRTGDYHERGIWGMDGYQAQFVVDKDQYIVSVPPELEGPGVLVEPLSVVEKAIDEAVRIQLSRLPDGLARPDWLFDRRCLVAGLGPVGLLAALVLRIRGARVYGLDIVDPGTARPKWLEAIGGMYIDGRQVPADKVDESIGAMDLVLDATGAAGIEFNLLDALDLNGIYVLTGIPGGSSAIQIPGGELLRQMVLDNQVMFGSVNAARDHFQMAVDDLLFAHYRWTGATEKLITDRYAFTGFNTAFSQHKEDEIKVVIEWGNNGK
ncbi:MAG: glucose 1-dehydrogenase [Omnitrophica WOR_2 bacterium]